MNKTWIIIQREFAVRVKKKSFIILTILMPFLMAAIVFVPALLGQLNNDEQCRVAVIDKTGLYGSVLKDTQNIVFEQQKPQRVLDEQVRANLEREENPYDAVVALTASLDVPGAVVVYSASEVPHRVEEYINNRLTSILRNEKLGAYRIADVDQLLEDANAECRVRTVRWDKDGKSFASSSEIAGLVGLLLALFIYTFILCYGSAVMQGVMEEKTNRIVEIMVSSVRAHQLMAGKIIGVAFVGLFQFLVWALMLMSLFAIVGTVTGLTTSACSVPLEVQPGAVPAPAMELLQVLQGMDFAWIAVLFVLYFIGGYLLFASFFAAIGASVNEQQDSQQFMMPIVVIFMFALYAGMFSIENPDGPLAMWCSFIPITSPVVMMVRIPFGVSLWQVALSLVLLYGTAAFVTWLSARIYRIGILMYGKKPCMKDMWRWLSYK